MNILTIIFIYKYKKAIHLPKKKNLFTALFVMVQARTNSLFQFYGCGFKYTESPSFNMHTDNKPCKRKCSLECLGRGF